MTSSWSVQPGISPLDWNRIGSFPLDGVYRHPSKYESKVEELIEGLLDMRLEASDPNFANPKAAFTLASLYQVALSKSDFDAGRLFNENEEIKQKCDELTQELSDISTQTKSSKKEHDKLERTTREMHATITQYHDEKTKMETENKILKSDNRDLNLEINRLREEFSDVSAFKNKIERENEDLLKQLKQQKKSSSANEIREVQISRENETLLRRFKETQDELNDIKQKYNEIKQTSSSENTELIDTVRQLQAQLESTQEQAEDALRTRDQVEDLCSRREQRALDDMQELVSCHNALIEEERRRTNDALEDLNACRQRLEQVETEYPKQMNQMKLEYGSQLDQRERRIKDLENEIANLKGNLAKIAGGGAGAASKALEEIMAGNAMNGNNNNKFGGGAGGGGAEWQKMISAMQTLQREKEDLSLQLTSAEQRLESQEEDMLTMKKTLRALDGQDPGLKSLRLELADSQRKLQNVQDEIKELRRRNKELQDVSAYCESLKALCVKLGVSGEELAALNVRGGNTEIEVLRAEVSALQEEIHWLERDRKHWMHKLRLQPILDTRLRLELGLTPDQLRQVDILVDKLKAGSAIVENPQDDYYDKYHKLLDDHKRQKEIFTESVQKSIEDAVLMAYRKHSDDMYHSSVKGQQDAIESFSSKLREQLQASPLFKAASSSQSQQQQQSQSQNNTTNNNTSAITNNNNDQQNNNTNTSVISAASSSAAQPQVATNNLIQVGSSADASELSEALRQQRCILESQSKNIEQLQETLKERFEEVVKCREEARIAREDANNAAEERDRFRDVLMMRGGGGAGGVSSPSSASASVRRQQQQQQQRDEAQQTQTPASASVGGVEPLASSGTMRRTTSSSTAAGAIDDAGIDQLLLIERNLRKQLVQKEKLTIAQSEHIDVLQREKAQLSHKIKESETRSSNADHRVAGLEADIKNLSSLIDAKEDRIGELSRINDDLQRATNSADREILQKIILLRQREARLLQRIRLITEERDEAVARADLAHQRLVDSMSGVEFALKNNNLTIGQDALQTNNIALATATARIEEEDEVAASIDRVMGQLAKGELLADDTKVVADTWLLHSRLDQQRHQIEQAANISALRARIAVLEDALAEKEAANRALGSINVNSPLSASSSSPATSVQANAGGGSSNNNVGAQIEAETWKQKYTLAAKRLSERESECDMLQQSLDSAREALKVISEKIANEEAASQQQPSSSPTTYARKKAVNIATLEKELTRMKSVNLSLVRAFAEMQGERKHLQILVENKTRQIQILSEQLPVSQEKTNQVIANVMRENTMLQQQLQDASTQLKTFRVSLLAAQANSSILGNEASAYRMSAQRLMRQYMTNMIPMIESVRAALRRTAGALPLRSAKVLQERLGSMLAHIADTEKSSQDALAQIASLRGELKDAVAESQAYQSITVNKLSSGDSSSSSYATNLISQKDKLLASQKASARVNDRKIADLESQLEFTSQRIKKQEKELDGAIEEMSLLETQNSKFTDEVFINKMIELQDHITKHASASASTNNNNNNNNNMNNMNTDMINRIASSTTTTNFDINNPNNTVTEYREALQKQSQLNNENQRLQEALNEAKHNLNTLDSRCNNLRDELNKAENRSQEAIRALDDERTKQRLRDERVQKAHEEQIRIIQTANEHNITSLKSLLANKEKLIESLEARCKQEKAAHIEASMLDSVRLERLHEQLFRENNVTLEKLRVMVENSASSSSSNANQQQTSGSSASVAVHIETLTKELQQIRQANIELRQQNSTLEVQLQSESTRLREALMSLSSMASQQQHQNNNENTSTDVGVGGSSPSVNQQQQSSLNNAIGVTVEGALHRVNEQQNAVTESMRRREANLTDQNNQLQNRIAMLESQLASANAEIQRLETDSSSNTIRQNIQSRTTPNQQTRQAAQTTAATVSNTLMIRQLEERNRQLSEELTKVNQRLSENEARHKRNVDEIVGAQSAVRQQFGPQNDSESARLQKLVESNESLRKEMAQVNEQNTRLMQATALLRDQQRIQADNLSQQASHKRQELESALTARMQQIQRESSETLNSLNKRVEALQIDLASRVDREKTMQRDAEAQAQTLATLRVQLSQKDEVIVGLKRDIEYANRVRDQARNECNDAQRQLAKAQQENANAALVAAHQRNHQQHPQSSENNSGAAVQPPVNVTNYNTTTTVSDNVGTTQQQQQQTPVSPSSNITNNNINTTTTATTNNNNPRSPPGSSRSNTTNTNNRSGINKTPSPNKSGRGSNGRGGGSSATRHQRFSPNRFSPDEQRKQTSPKVDLPKDHPCSPRIAALVSGVDVGTNTTPRKSSPPQRGGPGSGSNSTTKPLPNRQAGNNNASASLEAAVSAVANRHVSSSNERQLESTLRDMRSLQRQTEAQLNETSARLERERVAWDQQVVKLTRQLSQLKEQNEKQNIDHKKELLQVMEERRKERDLARATKQRVETLRSKVTTSSSVAAGGSSRRNSQLAPGGSSRDDLTNAAASASTVNQQQTSITTNPEGNTSNQQQQQQDTTNVLSSISASSQQDLSAAAIANNNNSNSNTPEVQQQQQQQGTSSRNNNMIDPRPDETPCNSGRRKSSPHHGAASSSIDSRQLIEVMETRHATEVVKLHDQNRQAREQIAKMESRVKHLEEELAKAERESQQTRVNAQALREERDSARIQAKADSDALKRLENMSASVSRNQSPIAGGVSIVQTPHTLREVCEFTARLLSLEEELEATKKTLRVEKEIEIRQLTSKSEQLQRDIQNLENDNALLSKKLIEVLSNQHQQQPTSAENEQPNSADDEGKDKQQQQQQQQVITIELGNEKEQKQRLQTTLNEKRELEQQLLHRDGQILDLRFERESLKLRVDRLEMHVKDLLKASEEAGYKMFSSSSSSRLGGSRRTSPKDASTRSGGGGSSSSLRPGSIGAGQPSHARVNQLESVIEGMKGVVSKLQVENNNLKQKTVAPEKYEQAMKDLKTLKNRDVQLQEALQAMSFKVAQLQQVIREKDISVKSSSDGTTTTKPTETVSLMRKLKAAQDAAEQYQLELSGLRRLVGDKTPGSLLSSSSNNTTKRPSSAAASGAAATSQQQQQQRPASASASFNPQQQQQNQFTSSAAAASTTNLNPHHPRRVSFTDDTPTTTANNNNTNINNHQQQQNQTYSFQPSITGSGISEASIHQPRVLSSSTNVSGQIASSSMNSNNHMMAMMNNQQQQQQQQPQYATSGVRFDLERIPNEALNRPSVTDASASPTQLRQQLYQNYPRHQ